MDDKQDSTVALLIVACISLIGMLIAVSQLDGLGSGYSGSLGSYIDALPPSGAGRPSSPPQAKPNASPAGEYLGGSNATGRVAAVYVKVAENVFLALDRAPAHLREGAERWVDIEFPDLLANDIGSARAMLNQDEAGVQVGDVVEIKFAHKDNPRFFPVKELTRVTQLVARRDEMLAKEFERRILARNGHGTPPPQWLALAPTPPSSPSGSAWTIAADAAR
jgi:hypothetical protein